MLATMEGFQITITSHINPHCTIWYHIPIISQSVYVYIYIYLFIYLFVFVYYLSIFIYIYIDLHICNMYIHCQVGITDLVIIVISPHIALS